MTELEVGDNIDRIVGQWAREVPELDTRSIATVGRLLRVSRYVERASEQELSRFGLNLSEFNVLCALRRAGSPFQLSPAELSRTLLLSSGGLTKRIDSLRQAGLVVRVPDPHDGRGLLVSLTPIGSDALAEALTAHTRNLDRALAALSHDQQDQLASLVRELLLSFGDGKRAHRDRAYRLERRRPNPS